MTKKTRYTRKKDTNRAATVKDTATLVGVSTSLVQKVLRGERENETVMTVFMELAERKSALLDEVKKLIPFN